MLAVFSHNKCQMHKIADAHPESPQRLNSATKAINEISKQFSIKQFNANPINTEILLNNHSKDYIDYIINNAPKNTEQTLKLDADTGMNSHSLEAALAAAGAAIDAVKWTKLKKNRRAFCAIRPPGHHAEPNSSMGFCIFNNIAIAAKYAIAEYPECDSVAVVDFDVHHGNGTQTAFAEHENLFFASSHQFPFYPGSGDYNERGKYNNILNVPLPANSNSTEILQAYDEIILPAIKEFNPHILMISAGFDAHQRDPLAQFNLRSEDYLTITRKLCALADEVCEGRIVSVLEGGYDLQALYESILYHLMALAEDVYEAS